MMFYLRGKKGNRHKYKQYHGKYVHALETHWLSVNGLNSIYIYIYMYISSRIICSYTINVLEVKEHTKNKIS